MTSLSSLAALSRQHSAGPVQPHREPPGRRWRSLPAPAWAGARGRQVGRTRSRGVAAKQRGRCSTARGRAARGLRSQACAVIFTRNAPSPPPPQRRCLRAGPALPRDGDVRPAAAPLPARSGDGHRGLPRPAPPSPRPPRGLASGLPPEPQEGAAGSPRPHGW